LSSERYMVDLERCRKTKRSSSFRHWIFQFGTLL